MEKTLTILSQAKADKSIAFGFQFMKDQEYIKPLFFFQLGKKINQETEEAFLWLNRKSIDPLLNSGSFVADIMLSEENVDEVCWEVLSILDKHARLHIEDDVYDSMQEDLKQEIEHNQKTLARFGSSLDDFDFREVMDGAILSGMIEIVCREDVHGENQNENYGIFKNIHVDQWSVGLSGDSFAGHIYAQVSEKDWLKIPYNC
jgi:hypothetical protein